MNIRFENLPISIQNEFREKSRTYTRNQGVFFNPTIGTGIIKDILNMDVEYVDNRGYSFDRDSIIFKNENEYTLFLLKYDQNKV